MKKVLLGLTVSLILAVAHGQTAVYHPFPDSNASWNERCFGLNPSHTCMNEDYRTLYINGDTVIGAYTYHKIYHAGYTAYSCWNPPTNPVYQSYNVYYDCAIRQDSLQKKVYIYMFGDTLLYDFNLNLGDTVPPTYSNSGMFIVKTIDSVLVGNKYHKRFTVEDSFVTDTLIEGIGSVFFGLYNMRWIYPDGGCNFFCFNHDSAQYPINYNCTTLTNPVNVVEPITKTPKLSPNPFSAQTTLQTEVQLINATLTVDNCFGQTVAQIKNLRGQTITFNRDNLPSGLYLLRLTQDNKVIAIDKLIIADK
ncbi:MAG: T9SS type A sorting domain-containing protein [Bacteroidetes bacterium]|nr:T9SS type A sorting domain-containing protein [Bacteroidota bacterium]